MVFGDDERELKKKNPKQQFSHMVHFFILSSQNPSHNVDVDVWCQ